MRFGTRLKYINLNRIYQAASDSITDQTCKVIYSVAYHYRRPILTPPGIVEQR
jgi:hypothetical protein